MPMVVSKPPYRPFDKVYMDIVGSLPVSVNGNKYILTFQDDLTRFFDCYAMPDAEANTVARIFYDESISKYKIPKVLITDNGTNFLSKICSKVCKFLGITVLHTTVYHPQVNGVLERWHKTLAEYLRNFTSESSLNWDTILRQAVHVYNNTPQTSTKLTPSDCLFGFTSELPSRITKAQVSPLYNQDDYFEYLRYHLTKHTK